MRVTQSTKNSYSWFADNVIKIKPKNYTIFLIFYFDDVLVKTNVYTNFTSKVFFF